MATLDDLTVAVEGGKVKEAPPLVRKALDEGFDPSEILNASLIPAMDEMGERFSRNEAFIPELLMAARAMTACTDILKPLLMEEGDVSRGKAVIGTVAGDRHDIGKNLVKMLVESKGFEVEDLGTDVAPEAFVGHLRANPDCTLVLLSSLLTTTMPAMAETVRAIEAAGLRDRVKIFVGGAPVTADFAREIGADFYTDDAAACAVKAAEVV